jgi:protein SCO1/2
MTQALDLLPEDQAEQVVPIFITVDPERDTMEQLAEYAPLFHRRLVALTGSPEAIKAAAKAYRVYFAKAGKDDSNDYLMDHSTFIYLMGPDGRYVRHFAHNATPEEMAAAIKEAMAQG